MSWYSMPIQEIKFDKSI